MQITEIRIKLMDDPHDRLQAFCSITFDGSFVVRDLKIIQGTKGSFVAMPSRKLTDRCPRCQSKNHLRAQYCSECGLRLDGDRAVKDNDGRAKLYADIAHPINSRCREMIQQRVLEEYELELVRAQQPGYVCRYDDYGEESFAAADGYDERPVPPVGTNGDRESRHRIEPAAEAAGPPHHHTDGLRTENAPAAAGGNTDHRPDEEEPFGAGLI